jgi:hypothetical protein
MSKNGHDEWDSQRDRKGDGQYSIGGEALPSQLEIVFFVYFFGGLHCVGHSFA